MVPGKSEATSSTLHIKLRDLKKFSTPSPNTYNPQSAEKETRKSAASYSFGMKTSPGVSSKTSPAPNAYAVPPVKESPAYSLAARAKEQKVCLVPGPGTYEPCNINILKKKKPSYSLAKRFDPSTDRTTKPGPGSYISEKVKICQPSLD